MKKNGLFNGLSSDTESVDTTDSCASTRLELEDLRRQVLFLQGQVEDREKVVQELQQQMNKLVTENYSSNSAPASTVYVDTCNAATQTDRVSGSLKIHTRSSPCETSWLRTHLGAIR